MTGQVRQQKQSFKSHTTQIYLNEKLFIFAFIFRNKKGFTSKKSSTFAKSTDGETR